ncbi:DUF5682 family protein [Paludisphaera mucosa]|uniref:DUF5682 family protein n=1 Tax=Paludisphaera mucosa TaxID=3030827 RepID=A0ABT6F9S0_9BACT|nr:DUF5682 family protein [Paludisphaera mucosa]MDG3004335.1 DUF5682 family protein [Paludisphaera mucosa]
MTRPADPADDLPVSFAPLRDQLLAAAGAFADDARPLGAILGGLVDDVERAFREPLEIFPVCHHSPSSALHMARRLAARPPRTIFLECCEDLRPVIEGLRDCRAPVALQAFASSSEHFPAAWAPLSLVCPLTEFSAEYQAIAYALENPGTDLVFVDRSADHVFQWMPQESDALEKAVPDEPGSDDEEAGMHGSAVGVEIGSLAPTFDVFRRVLLKNARVQHFSEWYDQYVEEAVVDAGYPAYRQVLFLIGSLFRRLGTTDRDRRSDELRERHMWTRIKQDLRASSVDPRDALYVCGAAHAASRVAEFGLATDAVWDVPPSTPTTWLYGLLPSSYSAICHQFGHPRGAVTLAEARWRKSLARHSLKPFALKPTEKKRARKDGDAAAPEAVPEPEAPAKPKRKVKAVAAAAPPPLETGAAPGRLLDYLQGPPAQVESDEEELLKNCVRIVELARKDGYLASTADGIATYQTAVLLANLRNRRHPTPYDFRDAAITCLEKDVVPGKRDVGRLCDILLGGDRVGRIGFESLPPLARDVYDRLAPLPIALESRTIQRALLDFRKSPELLPCSDLLWKLLYLMPPGVVRPIMGQRLLGHVPRQESWDLAIGKNQGQVIQLGYEGVTVEHVLERRLKKAAFGPDANAVDALRAAEDGLLFLKSDRLVEELGDRAVDLLVKEPDARQAREIHARIARLVHYYRTTAAGLPAWLRRFVTTGYSHYATMLPNAFADRGVQPGDLAAMLQFIFTLESLALSLGCERSQLVIAVRQAGPVTADPPKLALLWAAECVLRLRDVASLRARFDALTENELTLPALPEYLEGLLLALVFTPLVGGLTVELLSKAFERLPDRLLMPWMPKLLRMLRPHADAALPVLVKEAAAVFPSGLDALAAWTPPWNRNRSEAEKPDFEVASPAPARAASGPAERAAAALLAAHPATTDALATAMGLSTTWSEAEPTPASHSASPPNPPEVEAARALLRAFPATSRAVGSLLG